MFYCTVDFLNRDRERVFRDSFTLNMSRDEAYPFVRRKAWAAIREREAQAVRNSGIPVTFEIREARFRKSR